MDSCGLFWLGVLPARCPTFLAAAALYADQPTAPNAKSLELSCLQKLDGGLAVNQAVFLSRYLTGLQHNQPSPAEQGMQIPIKWSGYQWRSLVEAEIHDFKRLGESVMARTFKRLVTELHVRADLASRFTQLG